MSAVAQDRSTGDTAAVRTEDTIVTSSKARVALAITRLATGFIFLWAFLDKTFGLKYSTGWAAEGETPSKSWLEGGTPAQGFMKFGTQGPFKDFFANLASPLADWLFMLSMLGVGAAVMLGIGLRVSAVVGAFVMAMMWLAEWPPTQGSTNPLVDYHVIYALVLIVVALTFAGDTWGLGKWWARLPIVQKQGWLR